MGYKRCLGDYRLTPCSRCLGGNGSSGIGRQTGELQAGAIRCFVEPAKVDLLLLRRELRFSRLHNKAHFSYSLSRR